MSTLGSFALLNGLGSIQSPKLYDATDGSVDPKKLEELKSIMLAALNGADASVNELEEVADDNISIWKAEFLSPSESAAKSIKKEIPRVRARLAEYRGLFNVAVNNLNDPLWDSTVGSSGMTGYALLLVKIQTELQYLVNQKGTLNWSIDQSFWRALLDRAAQMAGTVYNVIDSNLTLLAWITKNWWKVAIAAGVLFYVVPPLIKAGRAYKKGGADAAAEEFEGALRRGGESLTAGTKSAAAAAKKAAAAYASGGASLAVSGLSRRRRRSYRRVF